MNIDSSKGRTHRLIRGTGIVFFLGMLAYPLWAAQQGVSAPPETPVRDLYLGQEPTGSGTFDPAQIGGQGRAVSILELDQPSGIVKLPYEKNRIKRTVSLDATKGASGRWTPLTSRRRLGTAFFDWDDKYYYMAYESDEPQDVRFDLDGLGDGWLRGADNVAVQINTSRSVYDSGGERYAALLLNAARDKDNARWETLPVPRRELKVESGRMTNPPYSYVVMVGVPRSDALTIKKNEKKTVGLRVEVNPRAALTPQSDFLSRTPFAKMNLADEVNASGKDLQMKLLIRDQKERQGGENVKARLEVKNTGKTAVTPIKFFVRGYLGDDKAVGSQDISGETLKPGKTFKKDVELTVKPETKDGAVALLGGVDLGTGGRIGALASFEKVDIATVMINTDGKSVKGGATTRKEAEIVVRYWRREPAYGDLTTKLPVGWYTDAEPSKRFSFTFPTQKRTVKYKIIVPDLAESGLYKVDAELAIGGKKYTDTTYIRVEK